MDKFDTIFSARDKKTDNYLVTATIPTEGKKSYVTTSLALRGGYDAPAEAFLWHPNHAVTRMWAKQHEASRK
jgi:hypothetical protein